MWFKCSDNTGLAALYSGNEKENQRVYAAVVRPGDTVVDAGANWGVHTLYLAKLTGATGRVHAFEPHPQVVEELRWQCGSESARSSEYTRLWSARQGGGDSLCARGKLEYEPCQWNA